jgi:hypothetical protein
LLRLVAKCQVGLPSLAQFLAIPRPGRRLALHTAPGLCSAPRPLFRQPRGIVSAPLPVATPSRASVKPFSRPKYSRSITRDMHYYSGSVAMGATAPCIGIDERDEQRPSFLPGTDCAQQLIGQDILRLPCFFRVVLVESLLNSLMQHGTVLFFLEAIL